MDITGTNGGRQPNGHFGKGNRAARGNPVNRRMQELRRTVLDAEKPEDVADVFAKLRELAKEGDVAAIKLYLDTTIGRPPQALELTGADGEPLGLDWSKLEGAILAALKPFGEEARFAVALALREVAVEPGNEPSN